tara:strand:+ start:355 stop:4149 length:3795 start_codon:yes stop_codon:yes gene_type:complete
MALRKQINSGDFDNSNTWENNIVPVAGDSIVSYNNLELNMNVDIVLGDSKQSGQWPGSENFPQGADTVTSAAIIMRRGTLTFKEGVTVTLRGDLISMDSVTTVEAGVTINIDAANANLTTPATVADCGLNKFYVIDVFVTYNRDNREGRLVINGTESNPCKIECISGTSLFLNGRTCNNFGVRASGHVDATFTHFKNFGASPLELGTSAQWYVHDTDVAQADRPQSILASKGYVLTNWDNGSNGSGAYGQNRIIRAFTPNRQSQANKDSDQSNSEVDIRFRMVDCILEDMTGIAFSGSADSDQRSHTVFERCTGKKSKYWMNSLSFIEGTYSRDIDHSIGFSSNPVDANYLESAVLNTDLRVADTSAPLRVMKNCTWDRNIQWFDGAAGWNIENNVFACGFAIFTSPWLGHGAKTFRNNLVARSSSWLNPNSRVEYRVPDSWKNFTPHADDATDATGPFHGHPNNAADDYFLGQDYGSGGYGKGTMEADIGFQRIPYGTGKRDPNIPAEIRAAFGANVNGGTEAGRMGIGSFIKDNYFLEDSNVENPHVLGFGGGNGDGAHIIMDNIWEVGGADGQGECVVATAQFNSERATELTSGGSEGTHKTGAVYYAGNINLPSKNGTEAGTFWVTTPDANYPAQWQGPNASGGTTILGSNYVDASYKIKPDTDIWWLGHFPQIYTNNTFFTGVTEGAINVSENGYHKDLLRYAKNNIFWDSAVRTDLVWSIGDVSNRVHPDLVIPENINNNIKINQHGVAWATGGHNHVNENQTPDGYAGAFYNANGYRGLDLSNPGTNFTYTPLAGGAEVTDMVRRNAFGRDDAEFTPTVSNLPFVNYLNGTPRYALSFTGVATNDEAWQLISKQNDWTDAEQFNGMTQAGLLEFVRQLQAPVRTSNGFVSVLNDVDSNPNKYYDPEMQTDGNPLGNYGHLAYDAADDANKGLVAINAIYQAAGAHIGALGFTDTNMLPTAVNDVIEIEKNTSKSILISDLLSNDSDPDNDALRISQFSQGSKGSVAKTTTHLVYTPNTEETGTDTFTYIISDALGFSSNAATVTINISSVAPIATDHTNPNGVGNALLTITKASLLAGATDSDGNDASIEFNGFAARSAQATSDNISAIGNDFIGYQAPTGVTGVDSFTYTVIDEDGDIGQGTYTIVLAAVVGGGGGGAPIGDPKAVVYIDLQKEEATSDPFTLQPSQVLELFVSPRLRANEFVRLEIKGSEQKWCTLGTIINEDDTSGVTVNGSRMPREYRVIKSVTQLTTRVESN